MFVIIIIPPLPILYLAMTDPKTFRQQTILKITLKIEKSVTALLHQEQQSLYLWTMSNI